MDTISIHNNSTTYDTIMSIQLMNIYISNLYILWQHKRMQITAFSIWTLFGHILGTQLRQLISLYLMLSYIVYQII
jgi:hypothetical protein